jgi:BMFP domain-containing protein YqiC
MQAASVIEELTRRLEALFGAQPGRDIEKNVKALVQASLARLDLVTREDFDVQARVLARATEKLAELEARIAVLESRRPPAD